MSQLPHYPELTATISARLAPLRKNLPAVMKAFGDLGRTATAPARSMKRPRS